MNCPGSSGSLNQRKCCPYWLFRVHFCLQTCSTSVAGLPLALAGCVACLINLFGFLNLFGSFWGSKMRITTIIYLKRELCSLMRQCL